jgi:hypothetical protein
MSLTTDDGVCVCSSAAARSPDRDRATPTRPDTLPVRLGLSFAARGGSAPSSHDQGLWQVRGTVTLVGDVELDLAAGVVLVSGAPLPARNESHD